MSATKIVLSAAVCVVVGCVGALVTMDARAAPPAVHDRAFVPSGDTEIFVEIRGARKDAPVVLFLHEGPAAPVGIMAFQAYPGPGLEKSFIMAYMHQRGVLRSPDVPDSSHTLANYVSDVDHVVEYLRKRFNRPRVHLIGHGWGGTLGYLYLLDHPDRIGRFVAVAAPFNVAATRFASYEMTLQWARDANAQQAISDLTSIGSPPYALHGQLLTKMLWSAEAFGGLTTNIDSDSAVAAAGYAQYDPAWAEEQLEINEAMFEEISAINVEDRVGAIATPLLLITGREDAEVPYFSLKRGLDRWGGEKRLIVFDHSHHIPFADETGRFVEEATAFLLD
jgi:proline iminopeptidase